MFEKMICFDMDGTLADTYGVEGWEECLNITHDPTPYIVAKPLLNMAVLARLIHKAQRLGYKVVVISWLAIGSTPTYDEEVTNAKLGWLDSHLPSVEFDDIIITEYGIPKSTLGKGVLFDDTEEVRNEWGQLAFEPDKILNFLRSL